MRFNTYYYNIGLDERDEFHAYVSDEKDNTIFETHGFDIFEDGFMKHKEDLYSLKKYLVNMGVITEYDNLIMDR